MYTFKYNSPIGDIFISADNENILEISFNKNEDFIEKDNELIKLAVKQLNDYFYQGKKNFNLPLKITGSDFEKAVYNSLLAIDYGKVRSYKEIAQSVNSDKAYRAVGSACNKNKFIIVIPCHRVVASNLNLHGYAGGLDAKAKLLKLEGLEITKDKVLAK